MNGALMATLSRETLLSVRCVIILVSLPSHHSHGGRNGRSSILSGNNVAELTRSGFSPYGDGTLPI